MPLPFPKHPQLLPSFQKLADYLTLEEQAERKDLVTLFLPSDYAMLNEYQDDVLAGLLNPPAYPTSTIVRFCRPLLTFVVCGFIAACYRK